MAGVGMVTVGAASGLLARTANASVLQSDWAYCHHCAAMWYAGGNSVGVCAGSSAGHATSAGSYIYVMDMGGGSTNTSDPQGNWRFCNLCYTLFWGGSTAVGGLVGCCSGDPTEGGHRVGSTNYSIGWDSSAINNGNSGQQADWWWCGNCSELFFSSSGNPGGVCPLESEHVPGSKTNYVAPWDLEWPPSG